MLLVSKFMDLRDRTCIFFLCSLNKLSFLPSYIFSFLLQFLISPASSQIIKELCYSSSYSFQFHQQPLVMSRSRQFLFRLCSIQLAFLHGIMFKSCSSLLYVQELFHQLSYRTILSSLFFSSTILGVSCTTLPKINLRSGDHVEKQLVGVTKYYR